MRKFGNANVWKYFTDVFDYLGLSAVVEGKIMCVHGGLTPEIRTVDQINLIDRRQEVPHDGPFCGMMWSDPEDIENWAMSARGAGWLFGSNVTSQFNHLNGFELIARAHQLVMDGFKYWFPEQNLVTVWSCPNYTYRCGNVASILQVDENLNRSFEIFHSVSQLNSEKAKPFKSVVPYFL